jgi:RHS repeat-associated protein
MDEKLSVNPVTGTASLTIPLSLAQGRSGPSPSLAMSYDSGSGNGPWGFGWNLSVSAITRKTDKGLPQYRDEEESDVFVLSGSEDLVPILDNKGQRLSIPRKLHGVEYAIRLYRPRVEGVFARIERWQSVATGISHWRTITRDNVISVYGSDTNSRVADAPDSARIFSYLLRFTFDDKGNAAQYEYIAEDSSGIDRTAAHEANRTAASRQAQRYLKNIRYGNVEPYFPDWAETGAETPLPADWHFQVVLDYGDHVTNPPTPDPTPGTWPVRPDPFSRFRSGFEIRTYRRCKRILLFHNFADQAGIGSGCLVRSTDFRYSDEVKPASSTNPIYTFLQSITQIGYRRSGTGYLQSALPPLEFTYSAPAIQDSIQTLTDAESIANFPQGLDGRQFRLVDLDGEGLPGVLAPEYAGWRYKRNLSPVNLVPAPEGGDVLARPMFGPSTALHSQPVPANLADGQQLLDLEGSGQLDLVSFRGPDPGYFGREASGAWRPFRNFPSLPQLDWEDPNLRFVDLTGDGRSDILLTEDDVFTFHASLGEAGFAEGARIPTLWDEETGPRVVFSDSTQTLSLADLSGDGLQDIVRVRNGEVCYWPNLGYGRFGAKITMDGSPRFGPEESFDPQRVRLADIDGSGTADLLYVGDAGVAVCFNQSGNAWSDKNTLAVFPGADNVSSVQVSDLLGNGTACLVWSSPLPGQSYAPLRYVDLMGSRKPHLLTGVSNNLGAETRLTYAPSTRFYLEDELAGKPWITRLPFPVQVVERQEIYDWVGRSRFVTRYAYHHGYFDGVEREFRGFGSVEQWDTEEHRNDTLFPEATPLNEDAASFAPPALTKTWFHTGVFLEAGEVSRQYAKEYWPAAPPMVPDSVLDVTLTAQEMREAYRAVKGSVLRVEKYGQDGTARASTPYTVTEHNYQLVRLQEFGPNRHAVFMTHPRESVTTNYERQSGDPRISHEFTLEVDGFGNVLRSATAAYPRRTPASSPEPLLSAAFQNMLAYDQARLQLNASQHVFTAAVNGLSSFTSLDGSNIDVYRSPLPAETISAELTGVTPDAASGLFSIAKIDNLTRPSGTPVDAGFLTLWDGAHDIPYESIPASDMDGGGALPLGRRIVAHEQTLYRKNDLTGLSSLGAIESMALPGESYRLTLTAGQVQRVFNEPSARLTGDVLLQSGYVQLGGSDWWTPSGRIFYSAGDTDAPPVELEAARLHFFQLRRTTDSLGAVSRIAYDTYDLLPASATDAVGNVITAANDYRVMQPSTVTDPNGNQSQAVFDCAGQLVGIVLTGKAGEGDSLTGFTADLSQAQIDGLFDAADPRTAAASLLSAATTRIVYDLTRFQTSRSQNPTDSSKWQPAAAATIARETHVNDPITAGIPLKMQIGIAYSDGFGRECQHKIQAEPGPVAGVTGTVSPRWIASGWTIFNNKGKPVRKYEPFFTGTHRFEFANAIGVSSVLMYDPLERVVASLHPDNTWEKTVFTVWKQETWDGNDTAGISDPRADADVGSFFQALLGSGTFTSWYNLRISGSWGSTPAEQSGNQDAAKKAATHAGTPAVTHFDVRGRACLSIADNGGPARYATRTAFDYNGEPLAITDALGRRAIEYCRRETAAAGFNYVCGRDLAGREIYHNSMDGADRWTLFNALDHPVRNWNARNYAFRVLYDALQRPTHKYVQPAGAPETLSERLVYGETHPDASRNLKTRLFRSYDGAGMASHDQYDFKGNVQQSGRRLASAYHSATNWTVIASITESPTLDVAGMDGATASLLSAADQFTTSSRFDALNRPIQIVASHCATAPANQPSVIQHGYNATNLLATVDVWLRQASAPAALLTAAGADIHAITGIDYDAHGKRISVTQGNRASTVYSYDPQTFRLTGLTTQRPNPDPKQQTVQDVEYFYDPVGNITHINDAADIQNVIYFNNQRVDPSGDYTYDAIYRLTRATGREHLGQTAGVLNDARQITNDDSFRTGLPQPGDGKAMGNYVETYSYDGVGNLLAFAHQANSKSWTRGYSYAEPSRITAADISNRLSATNAPGDTAGTFSDKYLYDAHGDMTRMTHLPVMTWDEHDRLQSTARQSVTSGTPETTYYTYDSAGQRVRKITDSAAAAGATPSPKSERIYLGGFEIYRAYTGGAVSLERETLHVMDDKERTAIVETRTLGSDPAPARMIRYQYGNHLGSALLELDENAAVVSYEEYFPYGSTSYQAVRATTETPKRYRYTGKERDEENDLYYHGARYYAPWLGRWTACDPAGFVDGPNVYCYATNNPVRLQDPSGLQADDTPFEVPKPDKVEVNDKDLLRALDKVPDADIDKFIKELEGPSPPQPQTPPGMAHQSGAGQSLRAFALGGYYQLGNLSGHSGQFTTAWGLIPDDKAVGLELLAQGTYARDLFGGEQGNLLFGGHLWAQPGRTNIALYALGGNVWGQNPDGVQGGNATATFTGVFEALLFGKTRDYSVLNIGVDVTGGVQQYSQLGVPGRANTDIAPVPLKLAGIGNFVLNSTLNLFYSGKTPMLNLWAEGYAGIQSAAPSSPSSGGPVAFGRAITAGVTGGAAINLPFGPQGLNVLTLGMFLGNKFEWDLLGQTLFQTSQLYGGLGGGFAKRF